jgi:predicted DCC family thiol-disulfide oxidoreductase YuxK
LRPIRGTPSCGESTTPKDCAGEAAQKETIHFLPFPALPGWAKVCRAYGACDLLRSVPVRNSRHDLRSDASRKRGATLRDRKGHDRDDGKGEAKRAAGACYASNVVSPLAPEPEMLFYDGHCALCHRSVKFVLKHDRSAKLFRFAPLQGPTFEARVPADKRAGLPDSVVVLAGDGALLTRSDAFLHVLRRLGGGWPALAGVLSVIPRALRDAGLRFHRARALSRLRQARRFVPGDGPGTAEKV